MKTITRGALYQDGYVSIRRDAMMDTKLSFAARGVLAYILSIPDDKAVPDFGDIDDGKVEISTVIDELERGGYLVICALEGTRISDDPKDLRA